MASHESDLQGQRWNAKRSITTRRGAVMLLVVGAVGIALLASVGFMASGTPLYSYEKHALSQAQARMAAESAIDHVMMQASINHIWTAELDTGEWQGAISIDGVSVDLQVELDTDDTGTIDLDNSSFEDQVGSLANPLFGPPMHGNVGGWTLSRQALASTGLTVPRVGIRASGSATDGSNQAYVTFVAALVGSGTVSKELSGDLEPNAGYTATVDIGASSLPILEDNAWIELYAGSTLVATTREAAVLLDLADLEDVLADADDLLETALCPAVLIRTLIGSSVSTCELRFQTDGSPPDGELRIELHAESLGLLSEVTFDNVRFSRTDLPYSVNAKAKHGKASHEILARYRKDWAGKTQIIGWVEP